MTEAAIDWESIRQLLCELQERLLDQVVQARQSVRTGELAEVSDVTVADTIYAVDKVSEELILDWMKQHWPPGLPVELVMEGLEDRGAVTFPPDTPVTQTRLKLIIDPIDGTREIMWDRRSAWVLAGVAPQKGAGTRLSDIQVAAMTELPTTRAWRADQFSGVRGGKLIGSTRNLLTGEQTPCVPVPFSGTSLHHGFSAFASPFPVGKQRTAAIAERFYTEFESLPLRELPIFEDQYLSTGGQYHDLMTGRLRLYADLRPLIFTPLENGLCAHPYDVCTILLPELAGVIITAPDGSPLDAPLDTTTPVAWVGFANPRLAARARPALDSALQAWERTSG